MDNENYLESNKKFAELFKEIKDVEIIPWTGPDYVGTSVLKEYPNKGIFIPAVNKKSKKDSVALIKIGYGVKENKEKEKIILTVKIIKASRYLFSKHFYDFNDDDSPTKESLEQSKKSKQPIDLDELSRYEFHVKTNKFYDLQKNKYVSPKEIVISIYKTHLKTLDDKVFQLKMLLQKMAIEFIDPFNELLKKLNYVFFGKMIKKKDSFSGYFSPYSNEEFVDAVITSEKPKILGSDFPITYQSATTFIVFIFIIFMINYFWNYDTFGLIKIINAAKDNSLFFASLISILILIVDKIIPKLIFLLINTLIRLKWYLMTLKIKIKD